MSNVEQPADTTKPKGATRLAWAAIGLVGIIVGASQMYRGFHQIVDAGDDPKLQQLLKESDEALAKGQQASAAAAPQLNSLLGDVDKLGLADFRKQKQETAGAVEKQYGDAAAQFRLAAEKLDEAATHNIKDKFQPYFAKKAQTYRSFVDACTAYQDNIKLLLDKSIVTTDDLLPKLKENSDRAQKAEKSGEDLSNKADSLYKQAKESK